jgi:hypothetical protein
MNIKSLAGRDMVAPTPRSIFSMSWLPPEAEAICTPRFQMLLIDFASVMQDGLRHFHIPFQYGDMTWGGIERRVLVDIVSTLDQVFHNPGKSSSSGIKDGGCNTG